MAIGFLLVVNVIEVVVVIIIIVYDATTFSANIINVGSSIEAL